MAAGGTILSHCDGLPCGGDFAHHAQNVVPSALQKKLVAGSKGEVVGEQGAVIGGVGGVEPTAAVEEPVSGRPINRRACALQLSDVLPSPARLLAFS